MFRKTWEALAGAVVVAGSLMGAASVQAADLGGAGYGKGSMKDGPVMDRPHIGNWSGIYLGVNMGASWESYSSDYRRFADLTANPDAPKYSSSETNGLLGGHLGIQHQFGRIVVGVEGSWSGHAPFSNDFHGQKCFNTALGGGPDYHCQARMNSYFTVGPRLGLAHNNLMFYITGGYASGQIQSREYDPQNFAGLGKENWKWAARHDGWFIGGGAEMMLRDRWVLGLEYLHIDLDSQTHSKPIVSAQTRQIDGEADIVRLRLSYKFGRGDGGYTNQPLK
jgi:outer membrane immunogenic protein